MLGCYTVELSPSINQRNIGRLRPLSHMVVNPEWQGSAMPISAAKSQMMLRI